MPLIQKPFQNGRSERAWTAHRLDRGLHGLFDQPSGIQGGCPGYRPDTIVTADDLNHGRRRPLAIYKYSIGLAVRLIESAVKNKGIAPGFIEGKAAGCVTVGVLASENAVGLSATGFAQLGETERSHRLEKARVDLAGADVDYIIATVAELLELLDKISADEDASL